MTDFLNHKDQRLPENAESQSKVDTFNENREAILISLHPKHLEKIMLGVKKLEFRRRWTKSNARKLVVYATAPIQRIVMVADIKKVHHGSIFDLWKLCEAIGGGLNREELFKYFENCTNGYAVEFENIQQFIPKINPKVFFSKFSAPQSFTFLSKKQIEDLNKPIKPNRNLIFVSGAHGVGKSKLCLKAETTLGIRNFSASKLIKSFPKNDKRTSAIDDNQETLLESIKKTKTIDSPLLLDGHFVLIDSENNIVRIPEKTFLRIAPSQIITIIDEPNEILARNRARGIMHLDKNIIEKLQKEELDYAQHIASLLCIPAISIKSGDDREFIKIVSKYIFN